MLHTSSSHAVLSLYYYMDIFLLHPWIFRIFEKNEMSLHILHEQSFLYLINISSICVLLINVTEWVSHCRPPRSYLVQTPPLVRKGIETLGSSVNSKGSLFLMKFICGLWVKSEEYHCFYWLVEKRKGWRSDSPCLRCWSKSHGQRQIIWNQIHVFPFIL